MLGLVNQIKVEILRTIRNRSFVVFSVGMPVIFYFIFTNVVGGNEQVGGVEWKAYYLMSMTVFSLIGAALFNLGITLAYEKKEGWTKQLQVTPLPQWAYLTSKIITQSILNLGIIIIMFVIGAIVNDIHLSISKWVISGLWIWLGVLPFLALGTVLGTFKTAETAQAFANVLNLSLAVLGGLWMPIEILPKMMQVIGKYLPSYHYGHGAREIIAGHTINFQDVSSLVSYLILFMVLSVYITKKREAV